MQCQGSTRDVSTQKLLIDAGAELNGDGTDDDDDARLDDDTDTDTDAS